MMVMTMMMMIMMMRIFFVRAPYGPGGPVAELY